MGMSFIPLHVYSGFSYLQSGLTTKKIASLAKKRGYLYCGLTDNGTLSGFAPFYHQASKEGVKPVLGMDVQLEIGTLSLFVKNEEGYRNILNINHAIVNGVLDLDTILSNSKGLIAVYPLECSTIRDKSEKEFASLLYKYTNKFDKTLLGIPFGEESKDLATWGRKFAEAYSYLPVAFPHILYEKKDDAIVLDIVKAISDKTYLENTSSVGYSYFPEEDEIKSFYTEEEIENSYKVAISCKKFELIQKRGTLLRFENELGLPSDEYLRKLANNFMFNFYDTYNYKMKGNYD